MEQHILSLRYDGLDAAAHNAIGTAGAKQVITGAQMLLGAHAHYYLDGTVPDKINDRTAGYAVRDLGRRQGSLIADFMINLASEALWDVAKSAYDYGHLMLDAYAAYKVRQLFMEPPYDRRQRSLEAPGLNEAIFDSRHAREHQARRLLQRTTVAIAHITAPLGISASVVYLSLDGQQFDKMTARQTSGENINEWLQVYRETNGAGYPLS